MGNVIIKAAAIAALGAMLALAACSAPKQAELSITVKADGWTDASTPVIVKVASDDGKVDFTHALGANKAERIPLADGTYRLALITPINADGSIYTVPDAGTLTVKGGKADALEFSLSRIEAGDVTAEQMERAVRDIAAATAKGDSTLSGSQGKAIQERAAKNAAAGGKVDEEAASDAAEEASSEAEAAVEASRPAAAVPAGGGGSSASSGNGSGGSSPSGSSSGTSSGGSSDGGSATPSGGNEGGSSSGGGNPGPSQHEHTWVQQQVGTESVWVVDQVAWDEQVRVGSHIHCTCGMDWYDVYSYRDHAREALCGNTVITDYEWVHHDEVGHYEDHPIYQTVCSECGAVQ